MQFTRYLYIRDEVQYSLLISLLGSAQKPRHECADEVFFWAFELYFSGWETETVDFVLRLYEDFYECLHPSLRPKILKRYRQWKTDRNPCHVGTILYYMIGKTYNTDVFLQKYIPDAMRPENYEISKPQSFSVVMLETELEKYKTADLTEEQFGRAWLLLRHECRYAPYRTSHKRSVFSFSRQDATYRFREKWLYYAAEGETPIWNQRVAAFGGILNHKRRCVDFPTEEQEEGFHERYGYEPDEQPADILEKCVGCTPSKGHNECGVLRIPYTIDFSGNFIRMDEMEQMMADGVSVAMPPVIHYFV